MRLRVLGGRRDAAPSSADGRHGRLREGGERNETNLHARTLPLDDGDGRGVRGLAGRDRLDRVRPDVDRHRNANRCRGDDCAVQAHLGARVSAGERRGEGDCERRHADLERQQRLADEAEHLAVVGEAGGGLRRGVVFERRHEMPGLLFAERDVKPQARCHLDRRGAPQLLERIRPAPGALVLLSLREERPCGREVRRRGTRERRARADEEGRGGDEGKQTPETSPA